MTSGQNVGRDELAAMLGASHASDMVAVAAGTTAGVRSESKGAVGVGAKRRLAKDGAEEDVSRMDRAQAAALVARQFAGGAASSSAGGGATRHRAAGKRKRTLQHHLLVGDLMDQGINAFEEEEDVAALYQKGEEEKEDFVIRADAGGAARRKKAEAKVLVRRGRDEGRRRRRSSSSDSESSESSSSSSSSSDGSSRRRSRRGGRNGRERGRRRSRSNSSSSSSSEDEADIRRMRARERARRNQSDGNATSSVRGGANGGKPGEERIDDGPERNKKARHDENDEDDEAMSVDEKNSKEKQRNTEPKREEVSPGKKVGRDRRQESDSSSSSSGSSLSSDGSSSSDESSSDESDRNASLPVSVAKPLFVPKSKRGTVAEVELQQQKMEEAEKRRAQEAEKKALQSRALVAAAVSAAGKGVAANDDEGDEFDTGEAGGEFLSVPDDADPTEDNPDKVQAERDAWEVRELLRVLRDVDDAHTREKERKEAERRRALTDEERLAEDRRTGRYRAPGEARRAAKKDGKASNFLQRFHHRGAFYMDEDTLANAGKDDVRHRAAEYSRAATGEDKVDKSALPEVMQVKKFGFAGYSTKYKGLAKEDTTDRKQDFLPIRRGGGRGRRNGDGERYGSGKY